MRQEGKLPNLTDSPGVFHPSALEKDALLGSIGSPTKRNRYVTETDPRLTSTSQVHALDGSKHSAPTDTLSLNTSQAAHGLCPKLPGGNTKFLRGDGEWSVPANSHSQQHAITSVADHTSTATPNRVLKANANGLPVNASNTDAEVSDAVSKRHNRQHGVASAQDHTGVVTTVGDPGSDACVPTEQAVREAITAVGEVPSPGDTVVEEMDFGLPSSAGVSDDYSRADHTHGTPDNPCEDAIRYAFMLA